MTLAEGITLYHGSYVPVDVPDLQQCRPGKDFGKGFYLTTDFGQARRFTRSSIRKAVADGRISGKQDVGYVTCYCMGDLDGLACKEYLQADAEWLHCVVAHRRQIGRAAAAWNGYDVIAGKIANDNTNVVITAYMRGIYGEVGSERAVGMAISMLEPENLKDQICLRTSKALERISYGGCEEVRL